MCRCNRVANEWPKGLNGAELLFRLEMLVSMAVPGQSEVASDLEDVPLKMQFDGACGDNEGYEFVS